MSKNNERENNPTPEAGATEAAENSAPHKTPLELVKEQQAMAQKNLEVAQQRPEPSPEVPGASKPPTIRHHPQRQLYEGGENDPNYARLR